MNIIEELNPTERGILLGVGLNMGEKEMCEVCGFIVKKIGHEQRCKIKDKSSKSTTTWTRQEQEAWIGDSVHRKDVREFLLRTVINHSLMGEQEQMLTSNYMQSKYIKSLTDTSALSQPRGSSDHSYATVFEASYTGRFRTEYLDFLDKQLFK